MSSPKSYLQTTSGRVHVKVWEEAHGPVPKGMHVDHRNGDIHDNRLENLRLATPAQNIANSKLSEANKTGLKGLSWDSARGRFKGAVRLNRKQYTTRGDLLTVAAWLFRTREALHGEFARHR
ncbi:gene 3.8 protein [Pseudomonas phage gh-1]|uniref:Gene 3.8 protein n=1 Tax=Pseudomonas phage gh-1 TaxID=197783 RepID=Q859G2_9CAUD|nr:HNH endonuclease [Pseudomonas phage gh-1]AAO73153.1 gene 3.8 protein [Pseudomonas phage gh-1]